MTIGSAGIFKTSHAQCTSHAESVGELRPVSAFGAVFTTTKAIGEVATIVTPTFNLGCASGIRGRGPCGVAVIQRENREQSVQV